MPVVQCTAPPVMAPTGGTNPGGAHGRGGTSLGRRQRDPFRADIQGLRAVAILAVVLFHAKFAATGGYVGVDVFFVISGFLITSQLWDELQERGRVSFAGFYARRARRILPAATVVIVATVAVAREVMSPVAARRTMQDALTAVFYGANFRFAVEKANYLNSTLPPSPFQHFWSLGVEEQFYLVWPLLLVALSLLWGRRRLRARSAQGEHAAAANRRHRPALVVVVAGLLLVATISFVISSHETVSSPAWAYYSLFSRAWELSIGALLALARPACRRIPRPVGAVSSWAGLGAIVAAAFSYGAATPFPGAAALLPVLGAAAIIAGGAGQPLAAGKVRPLAGGAVAVLGTRPMQFVGAISYSWYLWHWPMLALAPHVLGHALTRAQTLAVLAVSLGTAVASYYMIEQPWRRARVLAQRPRLSLGAAVPMIGLCLAVIGASAFTLPVLGSGGPTASVGTGPGGKLTPAVLASDLRAAARAQDVPSNITPPLAVASHADASIVKDGCSLQRLGLASKPCYFGPAASKVTIALFGDSHAAMWFPALDQIAQRHGWRIVDFTKSSCPAADVVLADYPQCTQWRQLAFRQMAKIHPTIVVASWFRWEEGLARPRGVADWAKGVEKSFRRLQQSSGGVVFVSDVPTMTKDAPDCVSGHLTDLQGCSTPRGRALPLPAVRSAEIVAARASGATVVDPTNWFCTSGTCPEVVGNILVYRDNSHITPPYSRLLAPLLEADLVPAVEHALAR